MRTSKYRKQILSLFEKHHLLSIREISEKIEGADYSTVFRNVEQLAEEGAIRKIVIDKSNVKYEKEDDKSHDHFICVDCGEVEEIHIPHSKLPVAKNYEVTDLLVRGICEDCK